MANLKSSIKAVKGKGVAQTAARKNLAAQFAKQHARKGKSLERMQASSKKLKSFGDKGPKMSPADKSFLAKKQGVPGTTSAGKKSPKLDDIAAAKQKQTAATAKKSQDELKLLQGGKGSPTKGTGTDGPALKPDSVKTTSGSPSIPASAPAAVKADPKLGESWKKMTSGKPLTPEERGGLISAGVKAAIGYRVVTGKGAVTGGEGLI